MVFSEDLRLRMLAALPIAAVENTSFQKVMASMSQYRALGITNVHVTNWISKYAG